MGSSIDTEGRGFLTLDFEGVVSTVAGQILSQINPEGVMLAIIRTYAYFATGSTGAANLTCGVAADAITDASDILSAFDGIEGTVGGKMFNCQAVPANETEEAVIWEVGEYINMKGSATTVGLAGKLFIEYVRLA